MFWGFKDNLGSSSLASNNREQRLFEKHFLLLLAIQQTIKLGRKHFIRLFLHSSSGLYITLYSGYCHKFCNIIYKVDFLSTWEYTYFKMLVYFWNNIFAIVSLLFLA